MSANQPRHLRRREVRRLLAQAGGERRAGRRIDLLSRGLLGRPYRSNPLIGSPERAERFTAALDGFDCVTYIETVLALARAAGVDDFVRWLRKIRYEEGRVEWKRRNHYMTGWIRNNLREGFIARVSSPAAPAVGAVRVLDAVAGLPARRTFIRCVPKPGVARLIPYLQSGDLMFFVSTRSDLDVFHCGMIVREGSGVLMRHASRSHGAVVEQELGEFLKANRMTGVIVVRPREMRRRSAGKRRGRM